VALDPTAIPSRLHNRFAEFCTTATADRLGAARKRTRVPGDLTSLRPRVALDLARTAMIVMMSAAAHRFAHDPWWSVCGPTVR
jgi:hypothetical protein